MDKNPPICCKLCQTELAARFLVTRAEVGGRGGNPAQSRQSLNGYVIVGILWCGMPALSNSAGGLGEQGQPSSLPME